MCRSEKWTYLNLNKVNSLIPLDQKMRETPLSMQWDFTLTVRA